MENKRLETNYHLEVLLPDGKIARSKLFVNEKPKAHKWLNKQLKADPEKPCRIVTITLHEYHNKGKWRKAQVNH